MASCRRAANVRRRILAVLATAAAAVACGDGAGTGLPSTSASVGPSSSVVQTSSPPVSVTAAPTSAAPSSATSQAVPGPTIALPDPASRACTDVIRGFSFQVPDGWFALIPSEESPNIRPCAALVKSIPPGARAYGTAFFQAASLEPSSEPLFIQYVRESTLTAFISDVLSAALGTSVTATVQAGNVVLAPAANSTELVTAETPRGYLSVDARAVVAARNELGYAVGETITFTAIQRPDAGTLAIFQRATKTATDDATDLARSSVRQTTTFSKA